MDIPLFEREHLDPDLVKGELWEAFEGFVGEVLRSDYQDLRTFQAGKDGAIDLSHTSGETRVVVQCKQIGADGKKGATKEWEKVGKLLRENLEDPAGPPSGQGQYKPWYETAPAVTRFIYCVSSQFVNQREATDLENAIREVFKELAQHTHLSHLADMTVEVLDWGLVCNRLREPGRKHLVYRWFPKKRPRGLLPLSDAPRAGSFRAYLSSGRLVYYGRSKHLETHPTPEGIEIPCEEELLGYLEDGQTSGLILSGVGGVGKTRLTLEVGRIARERGWIVFHAAQGLKHEDLSNLAKDLTPADRVLILIDYMELQQDFDQVVDELNLLNETYGLRLRYVANCRASYYSRVEALEYQRHIDLSPLKSDAAHGWLSQYRRCTVRHILQHAGGLRDADRYLAVCADSPILAVFLSYLHREQNVADLHELLRERDFGTWVRRRVQVSFGRRDIGRDLAILASLFPMPDAIARGLDRDRFGELFGRLGQDGWVERTTERQGNNTRGVVSAEESSSVDAWVSAHDVLVDRILASYLESVSATVWHFADELLETATDIGCLRSALISVQRLVGLDVLRDVNWQEILARQMAAHPAAWRAVRDIVVRTPLLTLEQILSLLGAHEDVWEQMQEEARFQNALGWIGRRSLREEGHGLGARHRATLVHWIKKAAPHAETGNAVITAGLLLSPQSVRSEALDWICRRPTQFQTHYLLVAWLKADLPWGEVAEQVGKWAANHDRNTHLSFLVSAWLDAGADKGVVEPSIKAWLEERRTAPEAQFVYTSWLGAGGDKGVVEPSIKAWLEERRTAPEAGFVYKSWLDAGGDKGVVEPSIKAWLEERRTAPEAGFVYKSWLDAAGDKGVVEPSIKAWLEEHRTGPEAGFVYQSWLDGAGDKRVVEPSIKAWLEEHRTAPEAQFVYTSWLAAGGDFTVVRSAAIAWLRRYRETRDAVFVTKHLANQPDIPIETVEDILVWCRCHPGDADVLWRLTGLRRHFFQSEIRETLCDTADIVVRHQLRERAPLDTTARGQIVSLLSFLINHRKMRSGPLRNRVDRLLCDCLRNPAVYGRDTPAFGTVQRPSYVQRLVELIEYRKLDVENDEAAIRRFLEWVDTWQPERKAALRRQISFLKEWHPATELWDIVRFD